MSNLLVLRAKVRGFHVAGSSLTTKIKKATGPHKARLWDKKRSLGRHGRHHLVAYGLLRGIPYERIESCTSKNRPDPEAVLTIMMSHRPSWVPVLDTATVKDLLSPGTSGPQWGTAAHPLPSKGLV